MTLYDNTQICPACGRALKQIEYYSGRSKHTAAENDETVIDESVEYEDVRPHFAGYCSACAIEAKKRANEAVAERARKRRILYLILGIVSALIAAAGLAFMIWCRRNIQEIGSERWILGGTGTFITLAFTVVAGVFFFLRPVEKVKMYGQPYKEPDYAVLSEGAAVQAAAANMEADPDRIFFSVAEYKRRYGE